MDIESLTLEKYDPSSNTTIGTTTEEIEITETTSMDYPTPEWDTELTWTPESTNEGDSKENPHGGSDRENEEGTNDREPPDEPQKGAGSVTLGIIVAVIIAALLTVVVIGVIVFAMKKRKESATSDSGSTEMAQK